MIINGQGGQVWGALFQQFTQIGVERVFNHNLAGFINQQLGQQKQRVLRPQGDNDLAGRHPDTATRQAVGSDIIHQQRVIMLAEIACGHAEITRPERLTGAIAPFRMAEQPGINLTIGKRVLVFTPVERLADDIERCWLTNEFLTPVHLILLDRGVIRWRNCRYRGIR